MSLLGLDIDDLINFDAHVGNICSKAGRNLSVLLNIVQPFGTFAVGIR